MRKIKSKSAMSLVVLVITILVMLILAGVVIMSLSSDNPIAKARESSFKTNAGNYASELSSSMDTSLNVSGDEIKQYIPAIKKDDISKYEIQNGELTYVGKSEEEAKWAVEADILNGNPFVVKNVALLEGEKACSFHETENYIFVGAFDVNWIYHLYQFKKSDMQTPIKHINFGYDANLFCIEELDNGNFLFSGNYLQSVRHNYGYIAIVDENFNLINKKIFDFSTYMAIQCNSYEDGTIGCYIESTDYIGESNVKRYPYIYYTKYDRNLNVVDEIENKLVKSRSDGASISDSIAYGKNGTLLVLQYCSDLRAGFIYLDDEGNIITEKKIPSTYFTQATFNIVVDDYSYGITYNYGTRSYTDEKDTTIYKYNPKTKEYSEILIPDRFVNKLIATTNGDIILPTAGNVEKNGVSISIPRIMKLDKDLNIRWEKDFTDLPFTRFLSLTKINKNKYVAVGITSSQDLGVDAGTKNVVVELEPFC